MIENDYNKKISEITSINSQDFGYSSEGAIVNNREELRKIIEAPCLPACLTLYDKNIQTIFSSANKREIGDKACIGINYDSLDDNNQQILNKLVEDGIIENPNLNYIPSRHKGRFFSIQVPVYENDTVGKVSDRFMKIVSHFEEQDVLYGMHDEEPLFERVTSQYSEFLNPDENGNVTLEEVVDIIKDLYNYVYDEELHIFWEKQDLYNKHKKYQEKQKCKESKTKEDISK